MNILEEIHDMKGKLTALYYAMSPDTDEEFRRMGIKALDEVVEKLVAMEKHIRDSPEITSGIVEVCGVPVFKYDVKED